MTSELAPAPMILGTAETPVGTPGPDELVALLPRLLAEPGDALRALADRHGPLVHLELAGTPVDVWLVADAAVARAVLVDPDRSFVKGRTLQVTRLLLGDGLLTSEGAAHARRRRLVSQAFRRPRLAASAEVMGTIVRAHVARWPVGVEIDLHARLVALTLDIVGRSLFGVDLADDAHGVGDALDTVLSQFGSLTPLGQLVGNGPDEQATAALDAALDRLRSLVLRLVDERRRGIGRGDDLLTLLVDARDDECGEGDGRGLTDDEIHDEVMTLLLAGHETTANALAWTVHLLSLHPATTRRGAAEVHRVLGTRPVGLDDLDRLPVLSSALDESLRLFPPAWIIPREAIRDVEVEGHHVRAGAQVLVSPWLIHRDPRRWSDPDCFRPDRWTPGLADAARRSFALIPFGGGSRSCIGEHFARLEATIVLAELLRRFEPVPPMLHRVERDHSVTLRPRGGLPMRLEAC